MKRRRLRAAALIALVALAIGWKAGLTPSFVEDLMAHLLGTRTVQSVLDTFGGPVEARLLPHFEGAGAAYPPERVALLAFKQEKWLELWAGDGERWVFVRDYPILGASGTLGPKLREGDGQVPEGCYRIEGLNPNSAFHLSMKLDYPNDFDRKKGRHDGRAQLGFDIFIHGGRASVGCLAMGDEAIEDLFVLAARTGIEKVQVVIAPNDLRIAAPSVEKGPLWLGELYGIISSALTPFARPQ